MTSNRTTAWLSDLVLVAALAVAAVLALLVPNVPWPIEWVLGISLVLLFPGYAIVAAIFPEGPPTSEEPVDVASGTPSGPVLLALALVTSAVVVGVVGALLASTGGLVLEPVAIVLAAITVVGVLVAAIRRSMTTREFRRAPLTGGVLSAFSVSGTRGQNAAFVLAVVALVAAAGLTAAFPAQGEPYTEFAVLDENENGELVAENFPETIVAGGGHTFHFAVENNEHQTEDYTVVTVAQRVEDGSVTEQRRLDTFSLELEDGERQVVGRDVVPQSPGEDVRLKFFLYKGDVPETASEDNADIALQIWTDVVAAPSDGNVSNATVSSEERVEGHDTVGADETIEAHEPADSVGTIESFQADVAGVRA